MKIAVDGSFSTGKTTLFNELIKFYPELHPIEEVSRVLLAEYGLSSVDELQGKQKLKFEQGLIDRQISLELQHKNFIVDLSLIANLAYKTNDKIVDRALANKVSEFLGERGNYDLIFYIPIEFNLVKDGLRHEDEEFRKFIDQEIKNIHIKYNVSPIILSGDISQRLELAKKNISQALKT
jgi:nicotinamide riboside kinase